MLTTQLPMLDRSSRLALLLALVALPTGCAGDSGSLSVLIEPESTILDGIAAGTGAEEIHDGWSIEFSKYIIALGPVQLTSIEDGRRAGDAASWAVDLVQIPAQGERFWELSGLPEGRWDVHFASETAGLERHDSVSVDDFDLMLDEELTHVIVGTMTNPAGISCPPAALAEAPAGAEPISENAASDDCYEALSLTFSIRARAEVTYGPCSIDGLPGVAISAGEQATAALSMHGDHLFFGGFPEGSEGEVRRYAQWLADCDLDLDGTVTSEELARIPPAALVEFDERFPLGGSPLRPIEDVLTYVKSQLSTQGHFEGEGECSIGFDPLEI